MKSVWNKDENNYYYYIFLENVSYELSYICQLPIPYFIQNKFLYEI